MESIDSETSDGVPSIDGDDDIEVSIDRDLQFDLKSAVSWFEHAQKPPFLLVEVRPEVAEELPATLRIPLRRCYVSDRVLGARSAELGVPLAEILQAKLPDPGSVMAGDFGEIMAFVFESTRHLPEVAIAPKKWRLKQDRNKPAPHSDVLHFVLPAWPDSSPNDILVCSEVKSKSTPGKFRPVPDAIRDSEKDRTSRLASTLVWLRERALGEDLGTVTIEHLDRFLRPDEHPVAAKRYQAVVVICASLIDEAVVDASNHPATGCRVILISIPELRNVYGSVFDAALESMSEVFEPEEDQAL